MKLTARNIKRIFRKLGGNFSLTYTRRHWTVVDRRDMSILWFDYVADVAAWMRSQTDNPGTALGKDVAAYWSAK